MLFTLKKTFVVDLLVLMPWSPPLYRTLHLQFHPSQHLQHYCLHLIWSISDVIGTMMVMSITSCHHAGLPYLGRLVVSHQWPPTLVMEHLCVVGYVISVLWCQRSEGGGWKLAWNMQFCWTYVVSSNPPPIPICLWINPLIPTYATRLYHLCLQHIIFG
jgi:hypothetical protein